jgi:hypothetical protein
VYGAHAALRDAATVLGAGEPDDVANYPEQRHLRGSVNGFLVAISLMVSVVTTTHSWNSTAVGQRTDGEAHKISRHRAAGGENIFRNANLHRRRSMSQDCAARLQLF